jgi:glycosyltransferase involved in cell wall biosynthesis
LAHERVVYVPTHCDGGAIKKLSVATAALLKFVVLLLTRRPRLIHVHLASRASFWRKTIFLLLARLARVPYVVHLHGAEFHLFYAGLRVPGGQRFIANVFDRAAAVIVLSAWWQQWVRGISAQRHVHVLYNAVVLPAAIERAHAADCGAVLSLGRLGLRKGTFDLVEAFAGVVAAQPQAQLRLGGDGDLDAVRSRAAALGIGPRVALLGWVSGTDKQRELDEASVYVLASYNEGLPMSLLEAMAAGLPVVTTPVGGIPEAVTDGVEGFLVAPGDVAALRARLALLLADSDLRRRMGASARAKIATHFSSELVGSRLRQIYSEIEGRRTGG